MLKDLRLESEKTQLAMKYMGIDPEVDLKVLLYKDFISPGLTPQIVKMRYQAYADQFTETVREIYKRRDMMISPSKTTKNLYKKYRPHRVIGYVHPSKKHSFIFRVETEYR